MRPLLVTPGDPRGIGPEVAAKALAVRRDVPVVVVGDHAAFGAQALAVGLPVERCPSLSAGLRHLFVDDGGGESACPVLGRSVPVFDPGDAQEPVEVASIRAAVASCLRGEAAGLVTGPIHKGRLAARGFPFPGHTDFLGHLCGVPDPVMAFAGGSLMVALVTVHLPLRAVSDALTTAKVLHVVRTADRALRADLAIERPRLVVCGVNPHAGEGGLLGAEDAAVIAPAVDQARALGIDAFGPLSAEAAFRAAASGRADLVVAMYHDQGLAPLKLVDFGRSVNWTLGLPIVRTSVDHGTADDIAGKGLADPTSFEAALDFARRLTAPG